MFIQMDNYLKINQQKNKFTRKKTFEIQNKKQTKKYYLRRYILLCMRINPYESKKSKIEYDHFSW